MSEVELEPPAIDAAGTWARLVRNFGTLVLGEAGARLLSFGALIWMARELGPDGFGLVTLGTTLVVWFTLVADAGTEVLSIRDVSRRPERFRSIVEPLLGLRLALSSVAMVLLAASALVASARLSDRIVLGLFALVLPMTAFNLRWVVLGLGASRAVAAGNVLSELLFVVGVLLWVDQVRDTIHVPILEAAAELTYAAVIFIVIGRRYGRLRIRIDLEAWRRLLRDGAPLMLSQVARAVVYFFDILLVAVLLGRTQVGFYGAASKPVLLLAGAVGLFFVSFLSTYSAASADRGQLFRRTFRVASAASLLAAVIVAVSAPALVGAVFGGAYDAAAAPLAILVFSIPALAVGGGYGVALVAGDRQRVLMRNAVAAAVLNIAGNAILIPLVGINGAAAVTVASEVLNAFLNYRSAVTRGLAPGLAQVLTRRADLAFR